MGEEIEVDNGVVIMDDDAGPEDIPDWVLWESTGDCAKCGLTVDRTTLRWTERGQVCTDCISAGA